MFRPETGNIKPGTFGLTNYFLEGVVEALSIGAEIERQLESTEQTLTKMEEIAMLDHLTGARNFRALELAYQGLQGLHPGDRPNDRSVTDKTDEHSIIALDIDHFKTVNDTRGHIAGNEVLKSVAGNMRARFRERDLISRPGGDEFVILLPRTDITNAVRLGESIRGIIEEAGAVTVSVGVAAIDLKGSLEANIENADVALYAAKTNGRNQVAQFTEPPAQS